MGTSECDEILHRWVVATLDIATEEWTALAEPKCVEAGGFGEDGVCGYRFADLEDLVG